MLKSWFPLNGELEDYSSIGEVALNSNAVVNNLGKIGKCYEFNGTNSYMRMTNKAKGSKNITICFWMKPNTPDSWSDVFAFHNQARIEVASSQNLYYWYLDACGIPSGTQIFDNIVDGEWQHIAICVDNTTWKTYRNGVLNKQGARASSVSPTDDYFYLGKRGSGNQYWKGCLNDVRIYDEALSLKEIKEIAKAKILHYNFNHFAESTENLCIYKNADGIYNDGWVGGGHRITQSYEQYQTPIGWKNVGKSVIVYNTSVGTGGGTRMAISETIKTKINPTTEYTVSYYLWAEDNLSYVDANMIYIRQYNASGSQLQERGIFSKSNAENLGGNWWRVKGNFTTLADTDYFHVNLYVYPNKNITYRYFGMLIEQKNHRTEYVAETRLDKVTDSSGFGNHSTPLALTTTPQWTSDSVMGGGCYKFSGSNVIQHNNPFLGQIKTSQEWSVCGWVKLDEVFNTSSELNNFNNKNFLIYTTTPLLYLNNGANDYYTYGNLIPRGAWVHVAYVFRNSDGLRRIYCNGVNITTSGPNATSTPSGIPDVVSIGNKLKGYIADYRIYATALSDEDIKELYQSKGSVLKDGKVMVNEIVESENLFNPKLILQRQDEIGVNKSSKIITKDNMECLALSASSYYQSSPGQSIFTQGYFKPNTQYVFDFRMSGNLIYQGNEVPFGFRLFYTDGTQYDFVGRTAGTWKRFVYTTTANKTLDKVGVYYYIGDLFYLDIDNCSIRELNSTSTVNKKGQLITNEIVEYPSVNLETKTAYGADWVQLFYHDNKAGTVLFNNNKKDFIKCNTGDKISNFYLMELFRGKDGKFEFLLEYQSGGADYNRWKQTSNFTSEPIAGYEAVQCSWIGSSWGGLAPSSNGTTWVDGSPSADTWFYAIGSKEAYSGGIPKWNGAETGWVKIWVRCDNPDVFKMYKNGSVGATEFIEN